MFRITAEDGGARLGRLETPHGAVETPAFVVVGTDARVRCLEPEDIPGTKTQIIIANTFHLWRSLGDVGLADFPGLHEEMGWQGPIMTDSGGFQVFSLGWGKVHKIGKISNKQTTSDVGSPPTSHVVCLRSEKHTP